MKAKKKFMWRRKIEKRSFQGEIKFKLILAFLVADD